MTAQKCAISIPVVPTENPCIEFSGHFVFKSCVFSETMHVEASRSVIDLETLPYSHFYL